MFCVQTGKTGGDLMKSRFKILWLLCCIGILIFLAAGCNDTLRQFIIPVPPPTGDPGTLAHAVTVSTNVADTNGSDMHIDVSGDTSAGVVPVGVNPVFLGKTTNRAFVINAGDPNAIAPAPVIPPTVSVYVALLPLATTVNTVTLPATAINPVAGATNSAGDIYIADEGSNDVSQISSSVLAVLNTIPVGTQPVAIAGNSANNKIFVVNNGSNDVTEISTIDNTVVKTIPVGASPVWAVMSTDGLFVFVVNQGDGTVSVIDASLDIVLPCDVGPSCPSGNAIKVGLTASPSPNFAFYEPTLKRVYVSNTGEGTITVIKANGIDLGSVPQVLPAKLKDIPVSGNPTSVTALPDGTRAYAALGNCTAGVNHVTLLAQLASCTGNLVSVIDAVALAEKKTIPVGIGAVSIDASNDGSRVFVANAQDSVTDTTGTHVAGTISDISTNTDTEVMRKLAPQQDPHCVASTTVFCPVQTPFMVRTFP
jgi:YVTN family beta-propeller protein